MRKIVIAATSLALIAGSTVAFAASQTETGVISKIDTAGPSITLASGNPTQFWLDQNVKLSMLKVGEKVTVTYDMQNGKPTASMIAAAN